MPPLSGISLAQSVVERTQFRNWGDTVTLVKVLARCCFVAALAIVSSTAMAGSAPRRPLSFDQILKMQSAQARNERMTVKPSNLSAKKAATPGDSCTAGGGHCNFDSDCCSDNCYSGSCQAGGGGCTIGGGHCNFDSDCCSDNCYSGTCQAGSSKCSDGGAHCNFDSECCSSNCYSGTCQAACTSTGEACTQDFECCGGNCNAFGRCGDEPTDPRCP